MTTDERPKGEDRQGKADASKQSQRILPTWTAHLRRPKGVEDYDAEILENHRLAHLDGCAPAAAAAVHYALEHKIAIPAWAGEALLEQVKGLVDDVTPPHKNPVWQIIKNWRRDMRNYRRYERLGEFKEGRKENAKARKKLTQLRKERRNAETSESEADEQAVELCIVGTIVAEQIDGADDPNTGRNGTRPTFDPNVREAKDELPGANVAKGGAAMNGAIHFCYPGKSKKTEKRRGKTKKAQNARRDRREDSRTSQLADAAATERAEKREAAVARSLDASQHLVGKTYEEVPEKVADQLAAKGDMIGAESVRASWKAVRRHYKNGNRPRRYFIVAKTIMEAFGSPELGSRPAKRG